MAKKGLQNLDNPALAFITAKEPADQLQPIKKKPAGGIREAMAQPGQKIIKNRFGQESKTKRLQLVVKPSTHTRLANLVKARASTDPHISMNGLINDLLEEYLDANG